MGARSGDLQLELGLFRAGFWNEFVFQSRSTVPHSIRQGWLTVASRAPCSGGQEATKIAIDGGGGDSLSPGVHEVAIKFGAAPAGMELDLVVDLGLDDGLCARAPAISQSIPMAAPNRFVMVGSMALHGGSDLRGLRATYGFRVGGGGWLGRFLLTAEAGVGAAVCNDSSCGRDSDGNLKSGVAFPLAVDVRYSFAPEVSSTIDAFFLGAGYSFMPVRLPASEERRFGLHGLHVAPGFAFGFFPMGNGPFIHAQRTPLYECLLPIGVLIDPSGSSRKVGFSAGMSFRMLLPLLALRIDPWLTAEAA
jgi:hypothetical protein